LKMPRREKKLKKTSNCWLVRLVSCKDLFPSNGEDKQQT
jgi:hypothetical protein